MATKDQEELAALLLAAGISAHAVSDIISRGRLTRAETGLAIKFFKKAVPFIGRTVGREALGLGRLAVRGVPAAIGGLARTNPYTLAALLLSAGYIHRDEIAEVGAAIADDPRTRAAYEDLLERGQAGGQFIREQIAPVVPHIPLPGIRPRIGVSKRKVSKANRAVKQAMTWLKGGSRSITGAAAGKLPKNAFKTAVKAAGLANPRTKSKPGKGKSKINKLARRLKKWW